MQNLPQISTFIKYNKMNYWKNEIEHTDIENTRSNFFIIKFSEHKSGVSDWDKSFSMLPLIYAAYLQIILPIISILMTDTQRKILYTYTPIN